MLANEDSLIRTDFGLGKEMQFNLTLECTNFFPLELICWDRSQPAVWASSALLWLYEGENFICQVFLEHFFPLKNF